jgi:hypothetical protein
MLGLTAHQVHGWCRSERHGGDPDQHIRFEIDAPIGIRQKRLLRNWKQALNARFDQADIFMRISASIEWI